MKKILLVFLIIIFGNNIVQCEPISPDIPKDTVVVTRKRTPTKTEEPQQKKIKKTTPPKTTKTPVKKINKDKNENENQPSIQKIPPATGLKIYEQPKPQKTTKIEKKPVKCKDDPKSPCNARKAKPAQPRKWSNTRKGKKQPRKARPAQPRKIIPCT